jgi:hypothetical protein
MAANAGKRRVLLEQRARGRTIRQAAAAAGYHERTAERIVATPEFQADLQQLLNALAEEDRSRYAQHRRAALGVAGRALLKLEEILTSTAPPQVIERPPGRRWPTPATCSRAPSCWTWRTSSEGWRPTSGTPWPSRRGEVAALASVSSQRRRIGRLRDDLRYLRRPPEGDTLRRRAAAAHRPAGRPASRARAVAQDEKAGSGAAAGPRLSRSTAVCAPAMVGGSTLELVWKRGSTELREAGMDSGGAPMAVSSCLATTSASAARTGSSDAICSGEMTTRMVCTTGSSGTNERACSTTASRTGRAIPWTSCSGSRSSGSPGFRSGW